MCEHPEPPAQFMDVLLSMTTMIQCMTEATGEQDAADHLAALKTIHGCLGGRVLPPKYLLHGWVAQTFWYVSDADAANPLPDGMRLVIVTDSMRPALGIA